MLKNKIKTEFPRISRSQTPVWERGCSSAAGSLQRGALARGSLGVLAFMIFCFCTFLTSAFAQAVSDKKAEKSNRKSKAGEIVLDDILIEAIIEKPNVAILPTRRLKKFGEIDFISRSFAKELKALPEKSFLFDQDFDKMEKIKNLRKILKR